MNNNFKIEYLSNNQLYIKDDNKIMFISYTTVMFIYDIDTMVLRSNDKDYNYTMTTCKYLTKALEKLLKDINYKSITLNNIVYNCKSKKQYLLNNNTIQL